MKHGASGVSKMAAGTKFGIIGSAGRMGQALVAAIGEDGAVHAGGIDQGGDLAALAAGSDVLVDFSHPAALESNLDAAVTARIPIVVGTTGLEERHLWLCDHAAQAIPVLQTGNTSLGVAMLVHLVREAALRLDADWDIEIVEMHHRRKIDAPSGTALMLGAAAAEAREIRLHEASERGRGHALGGTTEARVRGAIGFASLRGGTAAGDHSAIFAGEDERIVLSHVAENRSIFARGAVRAALWLIGQRPGRYTMAEVLGL